MASRRHDPDGPGAPTRVHPEHRPTACGRPNDGGDSGAADADPRRARALDAIRQHDGNPITHLSKSSFETFSACPEQFRRRYILAEKQPTPPRMVLGNIVDAALTWQAQQHINGQRPEQGDLRLHYLRDAIPKALEREKRGIAWADGEQLEDLRLLGWKAILAYQRDLAPLLGRAIAAQRKLQFRLAAIPEWFSVDDLIAAPWETVHHEPV